MGTRITIHSIRIKNFRSIKNEYLEAKDMNIFVGLNDAGKSNVLKALNLFFCGETDYKTPFDFQRDFTYLYRPESHRPKEIAIEIKFEIPDSYKNAGLYTWRKIWKANGYKTDVVLDADGKRPTERSRIQVALQRVRYQYVPAVKSREYYKALLADVYMMASAVLDSPLEQSMKEFSAVLQDYTDQIHQEVARRIGIDSRLSIPQNMSEMFKTLVFETAGTSEDITIPLEMRGDGIQARHIPIILKYIADQAQKTRNRGASKATTIWGFEEPENGVELSRAFEMAEDFLEYSMDIQMFVTTHSPAFYNKKSDDRTRIFYTSRKEKGEGTKLSTAFNNAYLSATMGLMPLVAPYIEEKERELERTKQILNQNLLCDIPTIFVEGKTDKQYLELAIKHYSQDLYEKIKRGQLRIFTEEGKGGCSRLINWACAWIYSGYTSKAVVLFDKDEAGRKAHEELCGHEIYRGKRSTAEIQVKYLEPSDEILELYRKQLDLPYEIEHLLSVTCWGKLKEMNYVQPKENEELFVLLKRFLDRKRTIDNLIDDFVENVDVRDTIVTMSPIDKKKEQIACWVAQSSEAEQKEYLKGLERTIRKLEEVFR